MTRQLDLPLRNELRRLAKDRLQQSLDAMARTDHNSQEPLACPAKVILGADILHFPVRAARDAHWLLVRKPEEQLAWGEALHRLPDLLSCYRVIKQQKATLEGCTEYLCCLTAFTAGVMLPLLACDGRFAASCKLADTHRDLIICKKLKNVPGAGSQIVNGQRVPEARYILLSLVLWSLVAHHPSPL